MVARTIDATGRVVFAGKIGHDELAIVYAAMTPDRFASTWLMIRLA